MGTQGESWVRSAGYDQAPDQSDQNQNHAVHQQLATAALNRHLWMVLVIEECYTESIMAACP